MDSLVNNFCQQPNGDFLALIIIVIVVFVTIYVMKNNKDYMKHFLFILTAGCFYFSIAL